MSYDLLHCQLPIVFTEACATAIALAHAVSVGELSSFFLLRLPHFLFIGIYQDKIIYPPPPLLHQFKTNMKTQQMIKGVSTAFILVCAFSLVSVSVMAL
jgi:hypothetical protein